MNADPPRPRKSVLTRGQRRLLGVLLVVAGGVLANSVYLTVTTPPEAAVAAPPGLYEASAWGRAGIADIAGPALSSAEREIPGLYQWMLLAHFFGGGAATGLALGFVVWHLRNALARRNRRAVSYGIALVAGSLLLSISGLFILTEAASVQNRWIFSAHQVLAVLVPLLYLGHRLVSIVPPTRRALAVGLTSIGLLIAALLATHGLVAASGAQPAGVPAQSARPAGPAATGAVHDPFIPFVPNNLGYPSSKFFPSASTTTTGDFIQRLTLTQDDLAPDEVMRSDLEKYGFLLNGSMGSATCNRCHPAVVEQWSRSAHRFSSFNNPFYKAAVENLRTEPEGKVRSQWCGGCHDPNLMFAGKMTGEIDPMTPEAQAGLTCLACHAIDAIHGKAGNGNYNLVDNAPDPYLFATTKDGLGRGLHDMLVKSKPTVHKRQMLKPFFRQSEFCLTCHKVSLDVPVNGYRWLRGQNEYDNWQDSGVARGAARTFYLPDARKVCQDCHMPLEPAIAGEVSAKNGMVRSHRFVAVNTALPHLRGDQDTLDRIEKFLRAEKVTVDVFALRRVEGALPASAPSEPIGALNVTKPQVAPGERLELDVVVRNKGVGHTFPGGTNDSNEAWIELTVTDDAGRIVARSGGLGADAHVDGDAHFYKVLFVDRDSNPALKRDPQHFHALVYAHVIGPGTADLVRYTLEIPADLEPGALHVTARLLWRKFNRDYTEFVFSSQKIPAGLAAAGAKFPELPITEVSRGEAVLEVVSGVPRTTPAAPPGPSDWMRFNDFGIGNWIQQDNRAANWAFQKVRELAPERIDGPRNLARVAVTEGRLPEAYALLAECEKLAPGDARTAWFWGLAKTKEGRYDEAESAFERVIAYFPEDRTSHRELGRVQYLAGRFDAALRTMLDVLSIDPEDKTAHYYRMLSYRGLGRTAEASEAEKAYEKYKLDESQGEATDRYRLEHAADNRESQMLHAHPLRVTP